MQMAKRARVEVPDELRAADTDDLLTTGIIRDFGHTWTTAEWATVLKSPTVLKEHLRAMRTSLSTPRLSTEQHALQLFESFGQAQKYEAL